MRRRRGGFGLGIVHGLGIFSGSGGLAFSWRAESSSLSSETFSRATTATYVQETTEPFFSYAAGGSLSTATFTRADTATYTAEV